MTFLWPISERPRELEQRSVCQSGYSQALFGVILIVESVPSGQKEAEYASGSPLYFHTCWVIVCRSQNQKLFNYSAGSSACFSANFSNLVIEILDGAALHFLRIYDALTKTKNGPGADDSCGSFQTVTSRTIFETSLQITRKSAVVHRLHEPASC
jgi:hypothetical protein